MRRTNPNAGILILTIVVSIRMLFHGTAKIIQGIGYVFEMLSGADCPVFGAYGVYICEIIVPLAILFGWKTRLASLIYCLNMVCAIRSPGILIHSVSMPFWVWMLSEKFALAQIIK